MLLFLDGKIYNSLKKIHWHNYNKFMKKSCYELEKKTQCKIGSMACDLPGLTSAALLFNILIKIDLKVAFIQTNK